MGRRLGGEGRLTSIEGRLFAWRNSSVSARTRGFSRAHSRSRSAVPSDESFSITITR